MIHKPSTTAFAHCVLPLHLTSANSSFLSPVRKSRVSNHHRLPRRIWSTIRCDATSQSDGSEEQARSIDDPLTDEELKLVGEFPPEIPWLNKVVLSGRLGRDPELKSIKGQYKLCKFSMAVENVWDSSLGPDQEKTSWFDVDVWGSLAERVASVGKKGMRVGVTGTISVNSWTGSDGVPRESPTVTAETFEVMQSSSESSQDFSSGSTSGRNNYYRGSRGMQDSGNSQGDLPF